ncbi:hypothetical protein F4778DRAFT_764679 [Xylariomycetidae sp. FL2044]|nr:hypothetical protein F4778DRAFT_764679 [Xylariomycetidae sp. FL2044]
MDDIAVQMINAGDGDGAEIIFHLNGQRIAISIFPSSPHRQQPLHEDRLIDLLDRAVDAAVDEEEHEEVVDEVLNIILDVGKKVFAEVAPLNTPTALPLSQDLHTLLYPTTLTFCLKTVDSEPTISPIDPGDTYSCFEPNAADVVDGKFDLDESLPQYSSKEIHVLEIFVQGASHLVSRVLINNNELLCKARGNGILHSDLERELESLQRIRKACLDHRMPIRVPRSLGYVKHPELKCAIGFLREWVTGGRLSDVSFPVTLERRQKWVLQIYETVDQLHEIGVVWGDGKPSNIIIDEEDNAWLIDFGGGFTEGWVEMECAGTVEGDKQAVKNIKKFLNVEEEN